MRIALVTHGLPPECRTGVEVHTLGLARALARAGHEVEVFSPLREPGLPHLSLRREVRSGLGITFLATNVPPSDPVELQELPGVAEAFATFLDRQRPDVVHFQHLARLGLSLIDEARERSIPTVYTAHDFYPASAWYTGVGPDLSPLDLSDSQATARCDLARAWLARIGAAGPVGEAGEPGKKEETGGTGEAVGIGDTHMGVLPDELGEGPWRTLGEILSGEYGSSGLTEEEVRLATERRLDLDGRRRAAFAGVDLLLTPTEYLSTRLHEAGVGARPAQVLACGIDTEGLEGIAPPGPVSGAEGPLRFGYLGALVKHKGLDVLLRAMEGLEGASLKVFGTAHDPAYLRRLREKADSERVRFEGAYEPQRVGDCLARFDVLVVPSIWPENAPFVIREAYAAGRPVIASDVGALAESVRDGVDGQLVPAGDPEALRVALEACVAEPAIVKRWAAAIAPVRTLADQVADLEEWYGRLTAKEEPPMEGKQEVDEEGQALTPDRDRHPLPGHVVAFAGRVRTIRELSTQDLLRRALEGLDHLAEGFGLGGGSEPWLEALASGSALADRVREGGRSAGWLRSVFKDQESAQDALLERAVWREAQAHDERERADWLSESLSGKAQALQEEVALRAEAEKACRSLAEEKDWLQDSVETREREGGWLKGRLADVDEERSWLEDKVTDSDEERGWLQETLTDADEERAWLRGQLTGADEERSWLKDQLAEAAKERGWLADELESRDAERLWLRQSLKERLAECRWLTESLDTTREELSWVKERLDGLSADSQATASDRDQAQAALDAVGKEREWMQSVLEHRIKEVDWLRSSFDSLQQDGRAKEEQQDGLRKQMAETLERLDGELLALRNHELWVRDELASLAWQVTAAGEAPVGAGEDGRDGTDGEGGAPRRGGHLAPEEIAGRVDRAHRVLRALEAELRWRRGEMESALTASAAWTSRGLFPELRRRVRSWAAGGGPVADAGGEVREASGSPSGSAVSDAIAPDLTAPDLTAEGDTNHSSEGTDDPFGEGGC